MQDEGNRRNPAPDDTRIETASGESRDPREVYTSADVLNAEPVTNRESGADVQDSTGRDPASNDPSLDPEEVKRRREAGYRP